MSEAQPEALPRMSATYSPEDNKLRLYTVARLDPETYARVKEAGFKWAPKQELFVAPMWTPERAALLVELCGEIGDEDTSLVDRAEERAERFEEYSDKREADAHAAHEAVSSITSRIPLGQPILVGHHSEKRARKDAERIKRGMEKAVNMWETAQYWERRAKGAIHHAKYKELPGVRHRRIKGLEADRRKQEKEIAISERFAKMWAKVETVEQASKIANYDRVYIVEHGKPYGESLWGALDKQKITAEDAAKFATAQHARNIERARLWLTHVNNRITYERAMLGESGGLAADRFPIEIGGRVLVSGWRARLGWVVVIRVTKKDGALSSVRTTEGVISVEDITDYRAPEGDDAAKVKVATKLAPLVNYPGEGFRHMLKADYDKRAKVSDFCCVRKVKASDTYGAHRRREAPKEGGQYWDHVGVYLTDVKRIDPPAPGGKTLSTDDLAPEQGPPPEPRTLRAPKERTAFDDMRDGLKAGVVVVSAPQLFPTPPELAARMVEMAEIERHHRVLEPSAGTGNILDVLRTTGAAVFAVEINRALVDMLLRKDVAVCADFLTMTAHDLGGAFDRIVMNPPFAEGADVAHVTHAVSLLKPNGRVVAIMSAGVEFRQDKRTTEFRRLVKEHGGAIEKLPGGTFKDAGTTVNTVLVTIEAKS